jgi:hypothetical protein
VGNPGPRIFGAQFTELAGKVCDEAVPDLVALMEENRKVIGKSLALAELCGRQTRSLPPAWKDPPSEASQPGPPGPPLIWGDVRRQRVLYPARVALAFTPSGAGQQGRAVKHAARPFSFYGAGENAGDDAA